MMMYFNLLCLFSLIFNVVIAADDNNQNDSNSNSSQLQSTMIDLFSMNSDTRWRGVPEFAISEGAERCFHESLLKDTSLAVAYKRVIDHDRNVIVPCTFNIYDGDGKVKVSRLSDRESNSTGFFNHKADIGGTFKVCIQCEKGSWYNSVDSAKMKIVIETINEGNDTKIKNNGAVLESNLEKIEGRLQKAISDLDMVISNETDHNESAVVTYEALESTKFRSRTFALLTLIVTGLSMLTIVNSVRNFLKKENVI